MPVTKQQVSTDLTVNEDLDMQQKKARNADEGALPDDFVTKEQLETVAVELPWAANQW